MYVYYFRSCCLYRILFSKNLIDQKILTTKFQFFALKTVHIPIFFIENNTIKRLLYFAYHRKNHYRLNDILLPKGK